MTVKILALATATSEMSVALLDEGHLIGEIYLADGRHHAVTLLAAVDHLLREEGLELKELDLFAVTTGPGSFTGLRIGLATVKGLALVTGKPLVGVSTLATIALNGETGGRPLCTLLPARRDWYYAALYRRQVFMPMECLHEAQCYPVAELGALLPPEEVVVLGVKSAAHRDEISARAQGPVIFGDEDKAQVRAGKMGVLAWEKYTAGFYDDALTILPQYLQTSAAERRIDKEREFGLAQN